MSAAPFSRCGLWLDSCCHTPINRYTSPDKRRSHPRPPPRQGSLRFIVNGGVRWDRRAHRLHNYDNQAQPVFRIGRHVEDFLGQIPGQLHHHITVGVTVEAPSRPFRASQRQRWVTRLDALRQRIDVTRPGPLEFQVGDSTSQCIRTVPNQLRTWAVTITGVRATFRLSPRHTSVPGGTRLATAFLGQFWWGV